MAKKVSYHDYFLKDYRRVMVVFAILSILGNAADLINILERSPEALIINSANIIAAALMLVLHFWFKVSIRSCLAIGVYSIVANFIVSQILDHSSLDFHLYFMRAILFIALMITLTAVFIGKFHAIITSILFYGFYIYIAYATHSEFLKENMLLIFLTFLGYNIVMYTFVSTIQKSVQKLQEQNIVITKQKNSLEDTFCKLEETHAILQDQNDELQNLSNNLRQKTEKLEEQNLELQELNATKDKFFSIIAHDLKGPMGTMVGLLHFVMKRFDTVSEEKKRTYIENILSNSNVLYQLLENLLYWSRSQTGSISVNKQELDLQKVVHNVLLVLKQSAKHKGLNIDVNIGEGVKVYCDIMMLETVIRNLLSNAIKYSLDGGNITITGKISEKTTYLSVEDNGVGMSPELISDLFDVSKKVSKPGTAGERGTSLGLIITKEFLEKNDGNITINSQLNRGSIFTISLPAVRS